MPRNSEVAIKGGRVLTPSGLVNAHVLVRGSTVVAVGPDLDAKHVIDASGCVVGPGLVDLHSHLREPGFEEAETIDTGARAAALGGYTAVVAMPNTNPAIDCASVVRDVLDIAAGACCDVRVAGAITVGRTGERLASMGEMAALGVRLFTDDGNGVQDGRLMRRALEYASALDVTVAEHCEDAALAAGGHMHEGEWSSRLGIPGIPSEAEEIMAARDIALARLTGTRLHLLHISTEGCAALVANAKRDGVAVTAEAAPHHFTLTDAEVASYDPVFKVNPPLRTATDVAAIKAALLNGTIDAVATDHAPHPQEAKESPFDEAPPGMLGLETAAALTWMELAPSVEDFFAMLSTRPAAIAGLATEQGVGIAEGAPANLCVFDGAATWIVEPTELASRSRNTPYANRKLTGKVRHTIFRGEPVVIDGVATR